jgi:hypothetical protein
MSLNSCFFFKFRWFEPEHVVQHSQQPILLARDVPFQLQNQLRTIFRHSSSTKGNRCQVEELTLHAASGATSSRNDWFELILLLFGLNFYKKRLL